MGLTRWLPRTRQSWAKFAVAALLLLLILGAVGFACLSWWTDHQLEAAQQAIDQHDPERALVILEKTLTVRPSNARAHLLAARCARINSSFDQAEHHLSELRRLAGRDQDSYRLEMLLLRAQRGEVRELEPEFRASLSLDVPEVSLVLEALCRGHLVEKDHKRAVEFAKPWVERQPDNPRAHLALGIAHLRLRNVKEAAQHCERAVELAPRLLSARIGLAESLLDLMRSEEAIPHLEYFLEHDPNHLSARLYLIECYREVSNRDRAWALLRPLLLEHPRDEFALIEEIKLLMLDKKWEEAVTKLQRVLEMIPGHATVHLYLSQALSRVGRIAEAEKHRAEFKKLAPDVHLERLAQRLFLIHNDPHNPALYTETGTMMLKLGMLDRALKMFETALEKNPTHRETHQALAEYYLKKGETQRAQRHRQMANPTQLEPLPPR